MAVQNSNTKQIVRNRLCIQCGYLNAANYLVCQHCSNELSSSHWVKTEVEQQPETPIVSPQNKPTANFRKKPTTQLTDGRKAQYEKANSEMQANQIIEPIQSGGEEETTRRTGFTHKRNTDTLKNNRTSDEDETQIPTSNFVGNITSVISTMETHVVREPRRHIKAGTSVFEPGMVISIEIDGKHTPIVLRPPQNAPLTFGRDDAKSKQHPDIDLVPYGGFQHGISRIHSAIELEGKRLSITDLGSSNGTFLNDSRLDPHESHQIRDGDTIRLGQMKLKISFKQ